MLKLLIPALALAAGLATPAVANPALPIVRVSYADLNLASESGLRTLDARISRAIDKVCGADPAVRDIAHAAASRACVTATAQAVASQRQAVLASAAEAIVPRLSAR